MWASCDEDPCGPVKVIFLNVHISFVRMMSQLFVCLFDMFGHFVIGPFEEVTFQNVHLLLSTRFERMNELIQLIIFSQRSEHHLC